VYLAGEFMRVPAAVNQSYTKSIVPAAAINDNRTFADASIHTVAITKNAELVPGTPGSGQYITISSLTSANNYRLKYPVQSDTKTRIKIIPLGVWNMWNTIIPSKVITLPAEILPTMVRSISAIIQDDAGQLYDYMIVVGAQTGGYFKVVPGSKQLQFHIRAGGFFESVEFTGGATANRGYVTIIYEP
jgi:hypothetical protein